MTNESLKEYLNQQGLKANGEGVFTLEDLSFSCQVNGKNVLFVANKSARANLLLAPESDYTQQADQIGVSEESKIGCSDFDQRFVIRDPEGQAESVLTDEVVSKVLEMEPFVELEMNRKQYRLLKEGLNEEQALEAVKGLKELVSLTS